MQSAQYLALAEDRLSSGFKYNRVRVEFKQQSFCGDRLACMLRTDTESAEVIEISGMDNKHTAIAEFSLH